MQIDLGTLVVIVALAAASPLIVDVVPRIVLPVVVVEILVGIIVGPPILNLIHVTGLAQVLADFGLAFLFFLAGFELDLNQLRGHAGTAGADRLGRVGGVGAGRGRAAGGARRGREHPVRGRGADHHRAGHAGADPARQRRRRGTIRRAGGRRRRLRRGRPHHPDLAAPERDLQPRHLGAAARGLRPGHGRGRLRRAAAETGAHPAGARGDDGADRAVRGAPGAADPDQPRLSQLDGCISTSCWAPSRPACWPRSPAGRAPSS